MDLPLPTPEAWAAGRPRIKATLAETEAHDESLTLIMAVGLDMPVDRTSDKDIPL